MLVQRTNLYRIIILLCGISAFFSLTDGRNIFIAAFIMIVAYLLIDLRRFTNYFQMDAIWLAAFIVLVISEGFFDSKIISISVGQEAYTLAARYLNVINATMLIGFNFRTRIWPETASKIQVIPNRSWTYKWIFATMYTAYLYFQGKYALEVFTQGRGAVILESSQIRGTGDLVAGFIGSFGLFLPAAIAYHFLFIKDYSKRQGLFLAILSYMPIFVIQIAVGVRSPIITALLSLMAVYNARYPFGSARALKLGLLGICGVLLTLWMRAFRGSGLQGTVTTDTLLGTNSESFVLSEGVVEYYARMIIYFADQGYRNGMEHLSVLLFWVPRIFWPSKPTQLESWFVEASGETGRAAGHSIAATFAATSLADFGFLGSVILWFLLGIAASYLNRFCGYYLYNMRGHPKVILAAIMIGLTFFAVRQISTIVFLSASIAIGWLIYKQGYQSIIQSGSNLGSWLEPCPTPLK